MLTLFYHPLCPFSRYVRLILGEYGIEVRLVEERFWERREEFLLLNPAGQIPVLVADGQPAIPGATIIAEYIEETHTAERENRLLPATPGERVEVRRLASWFNDKFHSEVSGPLVSERIFKRHMTVEQGGGPPDTEAMRAARHNIRYHLAYIGWLVRTRDWLAGDRLSLADLAAAAHLSAADYLGDVPWTADEAAKNWYARVKSRPSFRGILADKLAGLPPAKSYADLDFKLTLTRSRPRSSRRRARAASTWPG
jgi:glutathione S-transferase